MRSSALAAAPLVLLLAAACTGGDDGAADSALARDLALATATPPGAARPATLGDTTFPAAIGDTALGPAPVPAPAPERAPAAVERPAPTPAPAPRPAAPRPRPAPAPAPVAAAPAPSATEPAPAASPRGTRTVGAGTGFTAVTQSAVCSGQHRPGDKFVARVRGDVPGPDGVAIPDGAALVLELAEAAPGASGADAMRFRVRSVVVHDSVYTVAAEVTARGEIERTRTQTQGSNTGGRAVRGAVIGAILGQVLGGDAKSTVAGAAAGAAVGAATSRGSTTVEGCFPSGGTLDVRLVEPLTIALP